MSKPALNPPYRAEHLGSLKRPTALLQARASFHKGDLSPEELKKTEDVAITDIIEMQRRVGVKAITDGEFRRYYSYFSRFIFFSLIISTFG